jgi:hypothetical protein
MAVPNQQPDPDPKPVAGTASEIDLVLRWLAEALNHADEFAVEGNWEADGYDNDLYEIAERDYGIPPRVVRFFVHWLPRWASDAKKRREPSTATTDMEPVKEEPVKDGGPTDDTVGTKDAELLTEGVWTELAEELADAAGTWTAFDPPSTERAEQRRFDLTKLLLLAPLFMSVVLLAMVALGRISANDSVTLAGALLGPLYIPLGVAIAWHYNKPSS